MSFSHTVDAVRDRTKTVTRRRADTWRSLQPGDRLRAVVKAQGLCKGEHVETLATIEVVSVVLVSLDSMTTADCIREGFPHLSPEEFVAMFCRSFGGESWQQVRRIAFQYVGDDT